MLAFLWSIASFIVALSILVAVHEWGHFYVARRCGVKVQRFSIGFGKALWSYKAKSGTEYVLAAIPLGGYVKMLDERVEPVLPKDAPMAFNRQPVLARIAIVVAGPLVNFIFAFFALWLMFMLGVNSIHPQIGQIAPQSIAGKAGMQSDERIVSVGEHDTPDWAAVNMELLAAVGSQQVTLGTQDAAGIRRDYQLAITDWQFDPDANATFTSLGITPYRPQVQTTLAYVADDSAASAMGLQVGDKILAINGTTTNDWQQIEGQLQGRPNQAVNLLVSRDGRQLQLNGTLGARDVNGMTQGYLGVIPEQAPWPDSMRFVQRYNPIAAMPEAVAQTWRLMTLSVQLMGKLFTGDMSIKTLSGPISIAKGAGTSAAYGLVSFLRFLALISISLGIINLLPLPILDGGHLLYYLVELFTGRPVPESVQEVGFKIGGVLLLLLTSIAIFNDIARL